MAADDKRGPGAWDAEPRRSVFAALWFRVVLVVIVAGAVGVVAVPRVLDLMNPSPAQPTVAMKPAPSVVPTPMPAPAPEPAEKPPAGLAPAPSVPAASAPATTVAPTATDEKPAERPKTPLTAKRTARRAAKASAANTAVGSGAYWLQVGAFKDPGAAKRLVARLRAQSYHVVEVSTGAANSAPPARSGGAASDRYDVFVVGGSSADVAAKLSAKGLATEPAGDGVVVKPSLPLRDAVALSKDLAAGGLKVQVRRSSSQAAAAAAPAPAPSASGDGLHRVQVGPYADRAAATSTLKELEGKGYKPFIARR